MKISTDEFNQLMQTIADGWIEGNARTAALAGGARAAAGCFREDAIYVEPPEKQLYFRTRIPKPPGFGIPMTGVAGLRWNEDVFSIATK